ncbi:MAG: PQQ-dependent catabolism-associated CXXCW motif protein [Bradyrhizobiaceae bacterium]|nr:PQQ-dependent catabolism-associated CXXCW motif protein [Bradyrhizobiaceae bacterium]
MTSRHTAAITIGIIAVSALSCGAPGQEAGGGESRGQESSGAVRPAEPPGYRTRDYRAPTPATLTGARVVTTAEAEALWRDKTAIFIDVMPRAPKPANLPPGTVWRDRPRSNIPRSIWLPDTGYGDIAAATADYLRRNVERVTAGDRTRPLVVYCLRDCWMSWNAAKRLLAMGYVNVAWYPDGTDGWSDDLLPLAEAQPEPGQP